MDSARSLGCTCDFRAGIQATQNSLRSFEDVLQPPFATVLEASGFALNYTDVVEVALCERALKFVAQSLMAR